MRAFRETRHIVATATIIGFGATVSQILVLRELLVLFYGNEMSTGLIWACWLLWTASGSFIATRWFPRISPSLVTLAVLVSILAMLIPLDLLYIRASRLIWEIPVGELPALGKMLLISITATGLICPLSGGLFSVCWILHRQLSPSQPKSQPLAIYLGEALGAALAGLSFYYILLPVFSALTGALFTSLAVALSAVFLLAGRPRNFIRMTSFILSIVVVGGILIGVSLEEDLEKLSRRWQWGNSPVHVADTPYHNISVTEKKEQISVFINGMWVFSSPDILSREQAVHPALLQHPHPRHILLLGGGIAGHAKEILKHPTIDRIDYIEPDPQFIEIVQKSLDVKNGSLLPRRRVRLYHEDANSFIRNTEETYDAVLLNIGNPINAQMNRFYTKEFFTIIKKHLKPGGIFSFAVTGSADMLGSAQARFLSSINNTAKDVFADVLIYPGDQVRFITSVAKGLLTADVDILNQRIEMRKLALSYIREDTLFDALNPFRLDYFDSIFNEFGDSPVNYDFTPICYWHHLLLWVTQWHPKLENLISKLLRFPPGYLLSILAVLGVSTVLIYYLAKLSYPFAVCSTVCLGGAMEMAYQLIFLLLFQIFEGYAYLQLAMIIAAFMTGLASGTYLAARFQKTLSIRNNARDMFIKLQILVTVFPLLLAAIFMGLHKSTTSPGTASLIPWLFTGLSFGAGVLGGLQFSLAVFVLAETKTMRQQKIGGVLYGFDLLGSALGVLTIAFFILPIFGVMSALFILPFLSALCLIMLLRK